MCLCAVRCWQEQEDDIIDDCTAMVMYISPATGSHSSSGTHNATASSPISSSSGAAAAALAARLEKVGMGSPVKLPGAGLLASPIKNVPSGVSASPMKIPTSGVLGYKRT